MELFTQITALAALGVVSVQQILKLNIVPVYFANKYPVLTNIVLSIIASIIVTYKTTLALVGLQQWVVYVATVSVLSAVIYNMTIKNSGAVNRVSNKIS